MSQSSHNIGVLPPLSARGQHQSLVGAATDDAEYRQSYTPQGNVRKKGCDFHEPCTGTDIQHHKGKKHMLSLDARSKSHGTLNSGAILTARENNRHIGSAEQIHHGPLGAIKSLTKRRSDLMASSSSLTSTTEQGSPASTPGLRRRRLGNGGIPSAGNGNAFGGSVPDLCAHRSVSTSNTEVMKNRYSMQNIPKKLVHTTSNDSLDVGVSRFDVTVENNNGEHKTDLYPCVIGHWLEADKQSLGTMQKCQEWLQGLQQAQDEERPISAIDYPVIDWNDK